MGKMRYRVMRKNGGQTGLVEENELVKLENEVSVYWGTDTDGKSGPIKFNTTEKLEDLDIIEVTRIDAIDCQNPECPLLGKCEGKCSDNF